MKRRLLIVAVFLLAGAVVNVAVAWTCVVAVDPTFGRSYEIWSSRPHRDPVAGRMNPSRQIWVVGHLGTFLRGAWVDMAVDGRTFAVGCGWPLRAMWCEVDVRGGGSPPVVVDRNFIELPLAPWHKWIPRVLPLGIDYPGFAANTLFYAAVLGLLIPSPFMLRRFIRRRRGLCPGCVYPMGESPVCTECGMELTKPRL